MRARRKAIGFLPVCYKLTDVAPECTSVATTPTREMYRLDEMVSQIAFTGLGGCDISDYRYAINGLYLQNQVMHRQKSFKLSCCSSSNGATEPTSK